MRRPCHCPRALLIFALAAVCVGFCRAQPEVALPAGVKAAWGLDLAQREASATRERVSVNGLWRWRPAREVGGPPPSDGWGFFKVPGSWPGSENWLQKDCQTLYAHPSWSGDPIGAVTTAWYEREVSVPAEWTGRGISLRADCVNSYAEVWLDGAPAGAIRFPGGEVDLTRSCRPGARHRLSLLVVSVPLGGTMLSYGDTSAVREVAAWVERRGLCGDVWLESTPVGPRLDAVSVVTSVRRWEIGIGADVTGLEPGSAYRLEGEVTGEGTAARVFRSEPFTSDDVKNGHYSFTASWRPDKLWDINTPANQCSLSLSLLASDGAVLDTALPARFGFRELWIEGRDFYLNGTRIFLSAVPLDNAQVGAAWASYDGARESLERLRGLGINFVYTHNYDCKPGSHLSFEEALRAADDVGVLVALTQPHFSDYAWDAADADEANGYAGHAAYFARVAGTHPSVVMYSTSHNATGYAEDMNPDMIDGHSAARESWGRHNAELALRAQAIIERLDPARIVYHHSSGNLGPMHTMNFYTNFAPIQELSDWFQHWSEEGTKPVFTCEYMVPCTWDWTMYRGWYEGSREFGSATVPWDFSIAEWNSQLLGDAAYQISEAEETNIRWEAEQFRTGGLWHRWDYPFEVSSEALDERYPVIAAYLADNWRAFRTWEVSANSPWEWGHYWKVRDGVDRGRRELPVDWDRLQRPGFSADYLASRYERIDLAFERSDWVATSAAEALLRNNQSLLAYIAGKPSAVTSKDHLLTPGETLDKQLVVINNSRLPVTAECHWALELPVSARGEQRVTVETGQQQRVPLHFELPADLAPGTYALSATVDFGAGVAQTDSFAVRVMPRAAPPTPGPRIALFDPVGETAEALEAMGVSFERVSAEGDLGAFDTLVVGKGALTVAGAAPAIAQRVRDGLKVLVFEQTADALEKRLGFRVAEYGLRQVFERVPDHPALAGLDREALRDWRGSATTLAPRLSYELSPAYGYTPTVRWCGIEVPRVWRCGTRGSVASVLIEKPARGDLLPILDGGYSLQYSPLLEYREGRGVVVFCQMDVTGRTESDPAAEALARNLMRYIAAWLPSPSRRLVYAGDAAGLRHLDRAGFAPAAYEGGPISPDDVLVAGPGAARQLAGNGGQVAAFVGAGGHVVSLGLDAEEADSLLALPVSMARGEHIASYFEAPLLGSPLAGIGPADAHNRAPRELPLVAPDSGGVGDGVLGVLPGGNVAFCQLPPFAVSRAEGAVASFALDSAEAAEGRYSALVTLGTTSERGAQFGQSVKIEPEVGGEYTFSALVRAVGDDVVLHLEVERAGQPWDRAARGEDVSVSAERWTEVHVTYRADREFAEGWQAYIASAQEGGRFRVDAVRLYKGAYAARGSSAAEPDNLLGNPGFEGGTEPWWFMFGEQYNLRKSYRRASFLLTRLLCNMGAVSQTPLLARFGTPVGAEPGEAGGGPSAIPNGAFAEDADGDSMPDGWTFEPAAEGATCTRQPLDDGWAVRMDSGGGQGARGGMLARHDVAVRAGQWYRISLRVQAEGMEGESVALALQDTRTWQSLLGYQHFTPGPAWRDVRFLIQASGSADDGTRFQIWHANPGTLRLAGISMEPVPPPTEGRWQRGLYLDEPEAWDDPYRFFRW